MSLPGRTRRREWSRGRADPASGGCGLRRPSGYWVRTRTRAAIARCNSRAGGEKIGAEDNQRGDKSSEPAQVLETVAARSRAKHNYFMKLMLRFASHDLEGVRFSIENYLVPQVAELNKAMRICTKLFAYSSPLVMRFDRLENVWPVATCRTRSFG
uniref:Uncharacterized protein n=1 Tax=Oryza meridionalis TaxID=40149 RepID=A0A0E0EAI2_9ORYZ